MTTPPSLPSLAGLGWSVHKLPSFSTRVAGHVSGREVRAALYSNTLYQYELTFDGLDSGASRPGLGAGSLQTLMGFFLQCQGQFGTFLYTDPSDCTATGQPLGTGDGATTSFAFQRTLGGFTEPVSWVSAVSAVYLAGTPASGWSLSQPNTLTFAAAPGNGVAITADFRFAFVCRFLDDQEDFEEIMQNLWQVQSLKFRSVKP
jgi:uncharacterized protein (TIGR02217 family)